MKKFVLLFLTAAFIFALSSCDEQQKKQKKYPQKERHERRW
jgi:hypothetical protein